jgi:hypothetical protein
LIGALTEAGVCLLDDSGWAAAPTSVVFLPYHGTTILNGKGFV